MRIHILSLTVALIAMACNRQRGEAGTPADSAQAAQDTTPPTAAPAAAAPSTEQSASPSTNPPAASPHADAATGKVPGHRPPATGSDTQPAPNDRTVGMPVDSPPHRWTDKVVRPDRPFPKRQHPDTSPLPQQQRPDSSPMPPED
jgi:hypothetical protein